MRGEGRGEIPQDWIEWVRQELAAWYEASHRDLPWRKRPDPYHILVSEMMLVQTTVAAVIPFFERFLKRFPDPQTLADADEAEVLKAWEGLGYYRRARQLQAAARMIVELHQGKIPQDAQAVRALPGVGRYMAGAILSFAFDLPEPIVEANSQRSAGAAAGLAGGSEGKRLPGPALGSRGPPCASPGGREVQPGAHGPGGHDLHAANAKLPDLSAGGPAARRVGSGSRMSCPSLLPSHLLLPWSRPAPGGAKRVGAGRAAEGRGALVEVLGVSDRQPRRRRSRPVDRLAARRPDRGNRAADRHPSPSWDRSSGR